MNPSDVLKYGHQTVLRTVDGLDDIAWDTGGVCGYWSTRQIIAHLASFEQVLVEVLETFQGSDFGPVMKSFMENRMRFNDDEVARRESMSWNETLTEYKNTHARTQEILTQIPAERVSMPGRIPWYGPEYALDDLIVYAFYGHKREHCAQINVFRDAIGLGGVS